MNVSIRVTFNSLKPSEFLAQAQTIVTAMAGNPGFPEPWSSVVPTFAQIQADLAAFQNAVTATAAGDRTQIPQRNATRAALATAIAQLGYYVQQVAMDNEALLASSGYPLRQPISRSKVLEAPAAPTGLSLTRGNLSGSAILRATRMPDAGSYDVQITSGDPTVETNWTSAGSFKNSGRIELTGLATLKTWSARMRALGTAGPGAWSGPVSLLVI